LKGFDRPILDRENRISNILEDLSRLAIDFASSTISAYCDSVFVEYLLDSVSIVAIWTPSDGRMRIRNNKRKLGTASYELKPVARL
jgi:hypothetical protein